MCTLAFCHTRKMSYEEFSNCDNSNGDGIGFGFSKDGKQLLIKGFMYLDEAWDFYQTVPEGKGHVIHFRFGTSGDNIPELTHPFICSDTSPVKDLTKLTEKPLLFHNGVNIGWEDEAKTENVPLHSRMSDTRFMAMMIGKYGLENYKEFVSTDHGKFIILNKGKAKMIGDFIFDKGIYYSNNHYKYDFGFGKYRKDQRKVQVFAPSHEIFENEEDEYCYGGYKGAGKALPPLPPLPKTKEKIKSSKTNYTLQK